MHDYFPTSLGTRISQNINDILISGGFDNTEKQPLECLVFEMDNNIFGDIDRKINAHKLTMWSSTLNAIGELECYKGFGFLKILHIRSSNESLALIEEDETKKCSYVLKPGTLYFLDVIQYVPWEIEKEESIESPYDVELKSESDEITLLRKLQRVVGKYDLLRFIFKTPSGYVAKNTFLEVENKQGGEKAKYGLPALFLPIRIQPPPVMRLLYVLRIILVALAIGVVFASKQLAKISIFEADFIRTLALVALVLLSMKWDDIPKELMKAMKDVKLT
jgi:hypothetical protein